MKKHYEIRSTRPGPTGFGIFPLTRAMRKALKDGPYLKEKDGSVHFVTEDAATTAARGEAALAGLDAEDRADREAMDGRE